MSGSVTFLVRSLAAFALLAATPAHAVDSYRFFHVTIQTPWMIFVFLLFIVMIPFILSAILHWHFANKKNDEASVKNAPPKQEP